jgi:hypothetical protein
MAAKALFFALYYYYWEARTGGSPILDPSHPVAN